jgi:hypothetical protein
MIYYDIWPIECRQGSESYKLSYWFAEKSTFSCADVEFRN